MSKNIQLITDSGCDLPLSFLHEHNITLIPLKVQLKNEEFEDLISIQPKTVFDAMREGEVAKTAQGSPQQMEEIFTKLAKENVSGIYIAFSGELSGTYSTAVMVREQVLEEYPNLDLTIINTKCASLGQGLVVHHAAKLLQNGANKETIIEEVEFYSEHMEHLFTVDDLVYLQRGGRVSKASAFVGGLLNIKPLLNVEDGKLVPIEKIRGKGRKKVFNRMLDLMAERGVNLENQLIAISHADDEAAALELRDLIQERFNAKHFYINTIGAVIGAHAGPGTIALFFLNAEANTSVDINQ